MSQFIDNYFGPLGKEYCLYFYFMSMFFFVLIIISILGMLFDIMKKPKNVDINKMVISVMLLFNAIIAYFVNRLLNTMCINSVK